MESRGIFMGARDIEILKMNEILTRISDLEEQNHNLTWMLKEILTTVRTKCRRRRR